MRLQTKFATSFFVERCASDTDATAYPKKVLTNYIRRFTIIVMTVTKTAVISDE